MCIFFYWDRIKKQKKWNENETNESTIRFLLSYKAWPSKRGRHSVTELSQHGIIRYGIVPYDMVYIFGMVQFGVTKYDLVWYGVVSYSMISYGMVWHGMIWNGRV